MCPHQEVNDEFVRIVKLAEKVIGDQGKAREWLHKANRSLGENIPISLLFTKRGVNQVENLLNQIRYGIY